MKGILKLLGFSFLCIVFFTTFAQAANFGVGEDWATLYDIESKNEGRGEATNLLIKAKKYYEKLGKKFGGSVALNDRMKNIYKRLKITEYDDDYMARIWQEKKLIKIEIIENWSDGL